MADIFKPVVEKMLDLGLFNIFVFAIATGIFYALIKKSKIFGESVVVNGVIALMAAFFVFAAPTLVGINLVTPLATYFTQATVMILVLVIGFLASSFFYPDMISWLGKVFQHRTVLSALIALSLALFVTSGLLSTIIGGVSAPPQPGEIRPPLDMLIVSGGLIIFVVLIIVAASTVKGV